MDFLMDDGILIIKLMERVDSNNAAAFESELTDILENNAHDSIILGAENLNYISSAGLRVILRLQKKEQSMRIVDVTAEAYDIFEMTGFTEVLPIEKAYRKMSVDGCEIIGKGAKGTVYRLNGDTIIKVYNDPDSLADIHKERELARKAFILGVPTAISYDVVKVGESYGSVFELLDAKSFSQLIVEDEAGFENYVNEYAKLLRLIHNTLVKSEDMPDAKDVVGKWLKTVSVYLDEEQTSQLEKLMATIPDTLNMIHGDYHTNNLMMQNGETLLIDMDTLAHGHPIFDLINVYFTYVGQENAEPQGVTAFTGIAPDTAKKLWDLFIKDYLETEDEERINCVTNKIKLMALVRFLNHYGKRKYFEDTNGQKILEACKGELSKLLMQLDTLDF
ncbi:MAG: anti-sigma factor antagonist [Lachnospiraceae bacterium]|nr:anti-sigma factor antagonist [Lachnospiraceae bacterium]